MNKINQPQMNNSLHHNNKMEQLAKVEKLLCDLGWKSIDDYNSMFCAKDLTVTTEIIECFNTLERDITLEASGATVIQTLRKVLDEYNIPFVMRHKKDGNYLKLVLPDNTLQYYLAQKNIKQFSPSNKVDIMPDFNLHRYLTSLKTFENILNCNGVFPWNLACPLFIQNPDLDYVREYDSENTSDNIVVCYENECIYVPLIRIYDALYGFRVLLYYNKKNQVSPTVIGEWVDPIIQVGNSGSNFKCTDLGSSLVLLCATNVACHIKLPLTHEARQALSNGCMISAKIKHTGIFLNHEQRVIIDKNNKYKPTYDSFTLDIFGCGIRKTIVQPNNSRIIAHGKLSDISVSGYHILKLSIGCQIVPITCEYDKERDITVIKDFTVEKPVLAYYSVYHDIVLHSMNDVKTLKIMYSDERPDKQHTLPTKEPVKIQYNNYSLSYLEGICGIN